MIRNHACCRAHALAPSGQSWSSTRSFVAAALAAASLAAPAAAQSADAVTVKSGIRVDLAGTAGNDWVVERLYHDANVDDTVTVYLKSRTAITLSHGANNTDPLGALCGTSGEIVYKIDRDEQAGSYVASGYGARNGHRYLQPFELRNETYDGTVPVVGTVGHNGQPYGARAMDTLNRYWRGIRAPNTEEWHVLTAWDDDSGWFTGGPNGKVRASDGVVINLVVDPRAPVLRMVKTTPQAQFYTTPAKTYHTPVIHEQVTHTDEFGGIELYNLRDGRPIWVRLEGSTWTTEWFRWPNVTVAAWRIFPFADQAYKIHSTLGANDPINVRHFHYKPAYPSASEQHPSRMLWRDTTERDRIFAQLRGGSALHADGYRGIRDFGFYSGLDQNPTPGKRGGWNADERMAIYSARNAFVCHAEPTGPRFDNYRYAAHAKTILLALFTLPPIGHENTLWWPNPSLERVILGLEQMYFMDAAVAYDLLIAVYRAEQGHATGITPIEDIKIRDNFGNHAKTVMQFRDNCQIEPGEGDPLYGAGMDVSLVPTAIAFPSYSTHYYGTSGADGTSQAIFPWTPYPNQRITWWDSVMNRNPTTPGYPDMRYRSRIWVVYPDTGIYSGPAAYETLFYSVVESLANMGKLVATPTTFSNLDTYLRNKTTVGTELPQVCNGRFTFASQARQNLSGLTASEMRDVFNLCYYQTW